MGVYDIFHIEIECPKCKSIWDVYAQTKSTFCEMDVYEIGDPIDIVEAEIFVYTWCETCDERLFQDIKIKDGIVKEKTKAYLRSGLPGKLNDYFGPLSFPSDIAAMLEDYRELEDASFD